MAHNVMVELKVICVPLFAFRSRAALGLSLKVATAVSLQATEPDARKSE